MQNFAAIDFETANMYRTSVCSVGLVIVRDGIIADKFYTSLLHVFQYKDSRHLQRRYFECAVISGCLDASSPPCRGSDAGCS